MRRTTFLIDAFNLYHSVRDASHTLRLQSKGTKWLNIHSLCSSYLHVIGNNAQLEEIHYFSALAYHADNFTSGTTARHKLYINCLEATGVVPQLGRFKRKTVHCTHCGKGITRHEEKETDVAISAKLMELLVLDRCDVVVLVTGDTDIAPAVRACLQLFPPKEILFMFPFGRKNTELGKLARSFTVKPRDYLTHQFPDPFLLPDGRQINKPPSW